MASSSLKKEIRIRRKDLSGAKACICAVSDIDSRMEDRDSGVKMSMLLRLVKRRVLEGGVGCVSGGRLERSRVRLDFLEADEDDRDARGVVSSLGSIMSYVCICVIVGLSSSLST